MYIVVAGEKTHKQTTGSSLQACLLVEINHEAIECLPCDGVPTNLPTVHVQETEEEQQIQEICEQVPYQNEANSSEQESSSFLPFQQVQQQEQDAIRAFINGEDPLDLPSNEGDPINEFQTEGPVLLQWPSPHCFHMEEETPQTRED